MTFSKPPFDTRWLPLAALLGVALLSSAGAPKTGAHTSDREKFQGVWSVVRCEKEGKALDDPENPTAEASFEFTGDKVTAKDKKGTHEGVYKLNSSQKPKEIDFIQETPEGKTVQPGIYSLEGDDLKLCVSVVENKRPTDFVTKTGDERVLFILKRKKK